MLVENYTADTKMETKSHRSNTCGKYGQMMAATAAEAEKHDTTDLVINYCPDYDRWWRRQGWWRGGAADNRGLVFGYFPGNSG